MAEVKFTDNSVAVKDALEEACLAYLYEVAGELTSRTVRNSRPVRDGEPDVRRSWKYTVDEDKLEATVGSPLEASYWEELGTGEHALNKDGRKGWWVYIKGGSGYNGRTNTYSSREEAEAAAAYISAKHNVTAIATNGTEANRPLFRAFTELKAATIRKAETVLGARMK